MSHVIQIARTVAWQRRNARQEESLLLAKLCGSVDFMWRGGWAQVGEPDGVVVLRKQRCLGVWMFTEGRFRYVPVESGVFTHDARTADEAYSKTIELIGPILEEWSDEALEVQD